MQTWDGDVNLACAEPLQTLYSLSTVCAASVAGCMPAIRDPRRALESDAQACAAPHATQLFPAECDCCNVERELCSRLAEYPYLSSVLTNIIRLN